MTSTESRTLRLDETAAVRDVLRRLYAAWADNDAEAFAALYRDDATVVMPAVFHRGRAAVRDYMAAAFAGPLKGSRGVDRPQDIRMIGPDTAIVVSRAGIVMAGEEGLPAERERLATWVLSKQDDRWLVAAYANAPAR
ncbi:MAG TPA: SgcJ/EcaC family oxidoreductase [Micromonosporaceae bacterium]